MDEPEMTPEQNHEARELRDKLRRAEIPISEDPPFVEKWKEDIIRNQLAKNAARAAQTISFTAPPPPIKAGEFVYAGAGQTAPVGIAMQNAKQASDPVAELTEKLKQLVLAEMKKNALLVPPPSKPTFGGNATDLSIGWEKLLPYLPEGVTLRSSYLDAVTKNPTLVLELDTSRFGDPLGGRQKKDLRDAAIIRLIEAGKVLFDKNRAVARSEGVLTDWDEAVEKAVSALMFPDEKTTESSE